MNKFCITLIMAVLWACNHAVHDSFVEIEDAPIQNGMRLRIDKPVRLNKVGFFSYVHIPIEVTNFSNDTTYFENIFVFKHDHPVFGNLEFHIADTNGNTYSLVPSSRHYYEIFKRQTEYVVLPPRGSFQDKLVISFDGDYNLIKGKTYTIFAQYVNQRLLDTGTFPIRLPHGKQLWTGVLKSNTYKFKL